MSSIYLCVWMLLRWLLCYFIYACIYLFTCLLVCFSLFAYLLVGVFACLFVGVEAFSLFVSFFLYLFFLAGQTIGILLGCEQAA